MAQGVRIRDRERGQPVSRLLQPVVIETSLPSSKREERKGPQTRRVAPSQKVGCEQHKLFCVDTAPEFFIALSRQHALELWDAYATENYGLEKEDMEVSLDDVREVQGDGDFTLHDWDDTGDYLVALAGEWARAHECGFFASADY